MATDSADTRLDPVIVGVATLTGRPGDPHAPDAVGWMTKAAGAALADASGSAALSAAAGWVGVAEGTRRCSDAGAVIAERLGLGGAGPVHTVRADVGIVQQRLIAEACEAIQHGDTQAALVVGGESRARDRAIGKRGGAPSETAGPKGAEPDEVIHPADELMSDLELQRDLATPATQYAIVEDALAHADGLDRAALRHRLGDLWSGFAAVAADNPTAWDRSAPSGETIVDPEGGNRMVADPYTRSLCSQWNVDAASALLLTSIELADRLGIPAGRRVVVEATAESNLILPLPGRAVLHSWPAFDAVAEALAAHCGVPVDGGLAADVVDLYACFPAAVQVQARALGLPLDAARLTATGGMTFGGGPLNNAALASTAAVVERLRHLAASGGPARGLVTSISGMLTKPGAMMLSTAAPPTPFAALDVTGEATDRSQELPVVPDLAGEAIVDGATVITTFEGIRRAVAVVHATAGGSTVRGVATSDRDSVTASIAELGGAGRSVTLDGVGGFDLR